jgi:hypothetical protein
MSRIAVALAVAAIIGVAGSRPAAAVALADGNALTIQGVTFTVSDCGTYCGAGDVMVADGNAIGVTIESGSGGSLLSTTKGTTVDGSFSLSVSDSAAPIVGITGVITGSAGADDLAQVGAGETFTFQGGANGTGPSETLAAPSATTTFAGVNSLTIAKDLSIYGSFAIDSSPLVLGTISQVVTLQTPSRVPEPGALPLFATALIGLTAAMRRRRR